MQYQKQQKEKSSQKGRNVTRIAFEAAIPLMSLVFGIALFANTSQMNIDTKLLPQLMAVPLVIVSLLLLVKSAGAVVTRKVSPPETEDEKSILDHPKKVIWAISLTVIYISIIPWVGFFSSTALFMFALMHVLGAKGFLRKLAISVGSTAGIYVLFGLIIAVPLPHGYLI